MISGRSDIRTAWTTYKISDIAIGVYDGPHATPDPSDEGPVFLGIKNITEDGRLDLTDVRHIADSEFARWTKRVLPTKDDIVFSYEATLNRYALIPEGLQCCLGRRMALIRVDKTKVDPRFLYYYFFGGEWRNVIKKNSVVGATVDRLPIADFPEFPVHIPILAEQKRIASVLSALDDKIALNTRINAELEAMAKLLYDYWFVQFDFPNAKGKPYKSSGGAMVYNAELKREVPEGWEVGTLLDIANYANGLACQRFRPTGEEHLRVIKIKEMGAGFTPESEKTRPDIPTKALVENGDVLFSWSASLEVMIWAGGRGALNQHIFKVTSQKYPKSFFFHQLRNYLQHFKMMAENRKTTMGHITQEHLQQSRIVIPPLSLIKQLDEKIAPLLQLQVTNSIQNQELTALRDWLLPMLMNGQVVVGEAEEKVGLAMAAEPAAVYGKKRK